MHTSRGLLEPLVISVLGFMTLFNTGCATSIAARHPHLDRRSVCTMTVPGIEDDAAEFLISNDGVAVSNFHPEVVDRIAPTVRTVYEKDPGADQSSVRHLPAPFNKLTCEPVFSMLPSKDAEIEPLPEASVDLLVHEQRPDRIPLAIAKKLATCPSPHIGEVPPIGFSMQFNVYVDENGQAISALLWESTLGDRNTEGCFVNVLRTTSWSVPAIREPEVTSVSIGSKLFLADGPMQAPNLTELLRGIPNTTTLGPPQPKPPTPFRVPFVGVFSLLGPAIIGGTVFIGVTLLPNELAPPWISELNPITKRPYKNADEYEAIKKLTPEQILEAQIKATQPQMPPVPVPESQPPPPPPPPADPPPPPRREKPDKCPKIKEEIDYLITATRDKTESGYPQGYKGLKQRWEEYANNLGKWGYTKEGELGTKPKNHLAEYNIHRKRLQSKLDTEWKENNCEDKGHTLPTNTRQYAAQEPQLGPGKPLGPAPLPIYNGPGPTPPTVGPIQAKKP